jgi:hypothetical protein
VPRIAGAGSETTYGLNVDHYPDLTLRIVRVSPLILDDAHLSSFVAHFEVLERVDDNLRYDKARVFLVVSERNIPRRVLRAGCAHAFFLLQTPVPSPDRQRVTLGGQCGANSESDASVHPFDEPARGNLEHRHRAPGVEAAERSKHPVAQAELGLPDGSKT